MMEIWLADLADRISTALVPSLGVVGLGVKSRIN
jgi:hypothetical protein